MQADEADIKDIRKEIARMRKEFDALVLAIQHDREIAARDRENRALRLELTMERFERRLPKA